MRTSICLRLIEANASYITILVHTNLHSILARMVITRVHERRETDGCQTVSHGQTDGAVKLALVIFAPCTAAPRLVGVKTRPTRAGVTV